MDDEHVVSSESPRKPKSAREPEARDRGHRSLVSLELRTSGRHERLLRLEKHRSDANPDGGREYHLSRATLFFPGVPRACRRKL